MGLSTQIYQAAHCCSNQLSDEKSVLLYNSWKADDAVEFSSDMTGKNTGRFHLWIFFLKTCKTTLKSDASFI